MTACDDHRADGPDPLPDCNCAEMDRLVESKASGKRRPITRRLRYGVLPELSIAAIAVLAVVALVAACCQGCGSATSQHRALDTVAAAVDPSYALAVEACDEAEWVIVRREGSTEEQDISAVLRIRTTCNRVFGAFEALRIAHEVARAAVDGGGEAIKAAALSRLHEAWAALRAIAPEIERL